MELGDCIPVTYLTVGLLTQALICAGAWAGSAPSESWPSKGSSTKINGIDGLFPLSDSADGTQGGIHTAVLTFRRKRGLSELAINNIAADIEGNKRITATITIDNRKRPYRTVILELFLKKNYESEIMQVFRVSGIWDELQSLKAESSARIFGGRYFSMKAVKPRYFYLIFGFVKNQPQVWLWMVAHEEGQETKILPLRWLGNSDGRKGRRAVERFLVRNLNAWLDDPIPDPDPVELDSSERGRLIVMSPPISSQINDDGHRRHVRKLGRLLSFGNQVSDDLYAQLEVGPVLQATGLGARRWFLSISRLGRNDLSGEMEAEAWIRLGEAQYEVRFRRLLPLIENYRGFRDQYLMARLNSREKRDLKTDKSILLSNSLVGEIELGGLQGLSKIFYLVVDVLENQLYLIVETKTSRGKTRFESSLMRDPLGGCSDKLRSKDTLRETD